MSHPCQFCSVISKANGEDPIGTAGTHDEWIIVELPQPWLMETWQQDPQIGPMIALFHELIAKQGRKLRPIAIAPDRTYSQSDHTRILYYHRPAHRFAQYDKQDFLIPTPDIQPFIQTLLTRPDQLDPFTPYRQSTNTTRDILVCTHGNVDAACARFGNPIYEQLRKEFSEQAGEKSQGLGAGFQALGTESRVSDARLQSKANTQYPIPDPSIHPSAHPPLRPSPLRVWRCSHFGGHRFAPTLIDLPIGHYWGHLEPELLEPLINRQGSPESLYRCYRGWAGLEQWVQICDREIWMQVGWRWFDAHKVGRVLQQDPAKEPTWADVQIEYEWPDTHETGTYTARIEVSSEVETAYKSAPEVEIKLMKQYRVKEMSRSART